MRESERWLTTVVERAAVLARGMTQLTNCLSAQGNPDIDAAVAAYAAALTTRLREHDKKGSSW